jgi:ankyrin repeat protein
MRNIKKKLIACKNDHYEIAEYLISKNVNVNKKETAHGFAALHLAVVTGNLQLVKLLVNNKADLNSLNADFMTPLK